MFRNALLDSTVPSARLSPCFTLPTRDLCFAASPMLVLDGELSTGIFSLELARFEGTIPGSVRRIHHLSHSLHPNGTIDYPHRRHHWQTAISRVCPLADPNKVRCHPPPGVWLSLVAGGGTWPETFDAPIPSATPVAV